MMYPRLILARQLLREDGVIFISIDDNEIHNLRQMMNEIFGEENFLLTFCWRRTDNQSNIGNFARVKEYILAFAKDRNLVNFEKMELSEIAKNEYRYEDAKGKFRRQNLIDNTRGRRYFNVTTPSGRIIEGPWMAEENEINRLIQQDAVYWANGDTPYGKLYLQDSEGQITSDWLDKEFGTNQRGSDEINELFGKRVFDFPKPTKLITHFVKISNSKNEIILDFFAGSCTTAHSIIVQNQEDNGNRKFIMVQMNEKSDQSDYKSIADIGKERIRRVIRRIESKMSEETSRLPLLQKKQPQFDLGFKVFEYSRSNFKQWKPLQEEKPDALTPLFDNLSNPLIQSWKKEDLLSEVLLMEGFPLTSKVTYLENLLKNQVYQVTAPDFCEHDLFVCLDETLQLATIDLLKMEKEDIFICLDSALSDELKARLQDQFNVHVI